MPRAFVHDCDHHDVSVAVDADDDAGASFEQDECFVCEFQLDYFEVPQFTLPKFVFKDNTVAVVANTEDSKANYVSHYVLRGPPTLV